METLRKARPELQETLKTQDHRNTAREPRNEQKVGAAEIVKKGGLGVQTAYVERDRGAHVHECAKVCISYAYVCLPMCHVLCMLTYLRIVYMSICVHTSVSLDVCTGIYS